jgi:hypothetical protein
MAQLIATRTAQWPLVAEFTFNFNDTMVDKDGTLKDFKTVGTSIIADVIPLPTGAIVTGGEVVTETAVTGSTAYNVSVGDSGSATRYLGATDRVAAGRTALVPTGYVGTGENIRLTVAPTVAAATAGKVTVRVTYIVRNRSNEVSIV